MKNKASTYILLVAVIGIWGYVIYKIFQASQGEDVVLKVDKQKVIVAEDLSYYSFKKKDSLNLNFRDPIYNHKNKVTTQQTLADHSIKEFKAPLNDYHILPTAPETMIQYLGFVENENTKKKTAVIQVENEQYMLGLRETVRQITLLEIKDDYIRIKNKSKTRTIFK